MNSSKGGHVARREPRIQSIKGEKKNISFVGSPIFGLEKNVRGRVREGKKRKEKHFSLRSTEFCRLEFVGPRMKVHLLDEGYVWVPKTRDFIEDSNEEFRKSKVSGLGSVHRTS